MRTAVAVMLLLVAGCSTEPEAFPEDPGVSEGLDDATFWKLITEMSEPAGEFPGENLVSDERSFQKVIPRLHDLTKGGIYIGVGPEQNFTYIAALQPKLAFILDIRRGNLILHLFYKALFELSTDRADFVSRLFGRTRPDGLAADASAKTLMDAFRAAPHDPDLHARTLRDVRLHLTREHAFPLSAADFAALDHVADAFFRAGPDIDYNYPLEKFGSGKIGGEPFPSYAELMSESDDAGQHQSYLASEENFRCVADVHRRNALIPLVADFAGPKTVRSIGRFLADRGDTVTAFYTSNVELYLFQSNAWKRFYENLATLPHHETSTIIRFGSNRGFGGPTGMPGPGTSTRLGPMAELVRAFENGDVRNYVRILEMVR